MITSVSEREKALAIVAGQVQFRCTRRLWLTRCIQLAVVGPITIMAACQRSDQVVCADPTRLSDSENSLRASLRYTENSPRDDQRCRVCAFYDASQAPPCGMCKLLKGPVSPNGHCDSWSKAKTA